MEGMLVSSTPSVLAAADKMLLRGLWLLAICQYWAYGRRSGLTWGETWDIPRIGEVQVLELQHDVLVLRSEVIETG
jgi:hypothetical protein